MNEAGIWGRLCIMPCHNGARRPAARRHCAVCERILSDADNCLIRCAPRPAPARPPPPPSSPLPLSLALSLFCLPARSRARPRAPALARALARALADFAFSGPSSGPHVVGPAREVYKGLHLYG